MRPEPVAAWSELADRTPTAALVEGVDLVIVRDGDDPSVLYGRCEHRGALMVDGSIVVTMGRTMGGARIARSDFTGALKKLVTT